MNVKHWILGVVAGVVLAGPVVAGDEFYLIKIVNYDRKRDVMTMSAEEFKTLEKNLKYEEKFFPKAVSDVAKDWRADELNKGIPFPGGRLSPRTVLAAQKFPSQEKADAQLSRYQDQEAKKAERAAEREKNDRSKVKKTKNKSDLAREEETTRAADLVKAKVGEYLVKAGLTVAETAPAKGEEGKDAKADAGKDKNKNGEKKDVEKKAQ